MRPQRHPKPLVTGPETGQMKPLEDSKSGGGSGGAEEDGEEEEARLGTWTDRICAAS